MATHFAPVSLSVAALPTLFVRPTSNDRDGLVQSALVAAGATLNADDIRRTIRGRVAFLICELGFQLGRRGADPGLPLPIGRNDLADTLGIALNRVKRVVALLSLAGIIEHRNGQICVLDWAKLCACASCIPGRLDLDSEDQEWLTATPAEEEEPLRLTQAGDPACFV